MCRPRAFVFLWERENKYVKCIHGQTSWCVPLLYVLKVVGKQYLHGGGLLLFFLSFLGVAFKLRREHTGVCCLSGSRSDLGGKTLVGRPPGI